MAEQKYVEIGLIEGGWVTLRQNKSLRNMFTANIYTPLDRGMVLLQLCRWEFSHKETL